MSCSAERGTSLAGNLSGERDARHSEYTASAAVPVPFGPQTGGSLPLLKAHAGAVFAAAGLAS